ncbi:MAG: hypothetical protein ACLQHS_05265 [Candidatus Limnocylindrales bacterium]
MGGPGRGYQVTVAVLAVIAVAGLLALVSQGQLNLPGGGGGGGLVTVIYHLIGSATGASITFTDGSGNIQQDTNVAVPLQSDGGEGLQIQTHHGAFVEFMAQNLTASGDLTCSIEADGVVQNTGHASGAYGIVSCSATIP